MWWLGWVSVELDCAWPGTYKGCSISLSPAVWSLDVTVWFPKLGQVEGDSIRHSELWGCYVGGFWWEVWRTQLCITQGEFAPQPQLAGLLSRCLKRLALTKPDGQRMGRTLYKFFSIASSVWVSLQPSPLGSLQGKLCQENRPFPVLPSTTTPSPLSLTPLMWIELKAYLF